MCCRCHGCGSWAVGPTAWPRAVAGPPQRRADGGSRPPAPCGVRRDRSRRTRRGAGTGVRDRPDVAGPDARCVIVVERGSGLTRRARRTCAVRVRLDGRRGDAAIQRRLQQGAATPVIAYASSGASHAVLEMTMRICAPRWSWRAVVLSPDASPAPTGGTRTGGRRCQDPGGVASRRNGRPEAGGGRLQAGADGRKEGLTEERSLTRLRKKRRATFNPDDWP